MSGSSCKMERVWRNLPSDLLEEVMTFLPIASLCRFRVVSKKWNSFIGHPDFASRHARASSPEEYVFIGDREVYHFRPTGSWEVMDVANKRFLNFNDDFLAEFLKQEGIGHCPEQSVWCSQKRTILAANGGLLCFSYSYRQGRSSSCERGSHEGLFVCNPVLRTVKQLPHFAGWSERSQRVVMSTDRASMEYEIFIVNRADDDFQPNAVHIYKSKTASWRASAEIPGHLNTCDGYYGRYCMTYPLPVVLKDEFYAVFNQDHGEHAGLMSYNMLTGVVSDLGIQVPTDDDDYYPSRHLVVSDGRLFCVLTNTDIDCTLENFVEIVEIVLARKECIQLSVLKSIPLEWLLFDRQGLVPVVVTGLANSILIRSLTGRSLAYNLLHRMWHVFPDIGSNFTRSCNMLFGSSHCLSLCAP